MRFRPLHLPVLALLAGCFNPCPAQASVPDTVAPVFLCAVGEKDLRTILLTFDEPLEGAPLLSGAADPFAYSLQEVGGGESLFFGTAVVTNGNQVLLTLSSGESWTRSRQYRVEIVGGIVTDLFGNPIEEPNNTSLLLSRHTLVLLESFWEYDQSGVDLGTAWLSNDAPAFAISGQGLLGQELSGPATPLLRTDLAAPTEGGPTGHYFRTRFLLLEVSTVKRLAASYYVDDQAVIYLNGVEVHRTRADGGPIPGIPGEPVPYGTLTRTAAGDARLVDGIDLPVDALVEGLNTIQVYVAQSSASSPDVVWGMTLDAVGGGVSELNIISGPVPAVVLEEFARLDLSVLVVGGVHPIRYQWRKAGVPIEGATNATFSIPGVVPGDAGSYDVVVSDQSGSEAATSNPSMVTLLCGACGEPPMITSAIMGRGRTHVTVLLDEAITEQSATNAANYSLERVNDHGPVPILEAEFDSSNPAVVVLRTPLLLQGIGHRLTVAGLTDRSQPGNMMPSTTVSVPVPIGVVSTGHLWKYDQRDVDLGTAWREPGYDDSAWPAGPSVLGFEWNQTISTPLQQIYTDGLSVTNARETITYYFRTRFHIFQQGAVGNFLVAHVDYDDAFVMYLNGVEVARAGLPQTGTNLNHSTLGSSHESGIHKRFQFDDSAVVPGENVLAVEVHQAVVGSSDMVWDLLLDYHDYNPVVCACLPVVSVTVSPAGGNASEGGTAVFQASALGPMPMTFEWFRNAVAAGTGSTLVISGLTPADAGTYTVEVTNPEGIVTSLPQVLTVNPDLVRPVVLSCAAHRDGTGISIRFHKTMDPVTAQDPGSYAVEGLASGAVPVIGAVLEVDGRTVRLTTEPRMAGENYSVTISGVLDRSFTGNPVDPDPAVCSLPIELLAAGDLWSYREDDVPQPNDWFGLGFDDSSWSVGRGIFGREFNIRDQIATPFPQYYTNVAEMITNTVQTTTYYFRSHFGGAGHVAGNELEVVGVYDDGLIIYLNGVEVGRRGIDTAIGRTGTHSAEQVHFAYSSAHEADVVKRIGIDAGLLESGDNLLAIELHQASSLSSDVVLGVGVFSVRPACAALDPTIVNNGDGTVTISWSGDGELWASSALLGVYVATAQMSPCTVAVGGEGMRFFQVVCP